MKYWFVLVSCIWSICLLGCECLIIRIQRPNGLTRRLDLSPNSTFGDLYDALIKTGNTPESDSDKIQVGHHLKHISDLKGNITKLSEARIMDGDMVRIETTAPKKRHSRTRLAPSILREGIRGASKRSNVRTLADIDREKSLLIKITRQAPNGNVSISVPERFANWLRDQNYGPKPTATTKRCVMLFGKKGSDSSAGQLNATEVHAGVELNLGATSGNLDDSDVVIMEKAAKVGKLMGLTVVGCFWESEWSEHPPSAVEVEVPSGRQKLQPRSPLPPRSSNSTFGPKDVFTGLTLFAASRRGAGATLSATHPFVLLLRTGREDGREGNVTIEAFQFSDQALALHSQGILPAAADPDSHSLSPSSSLVTLASAVLLPNSVESTQVDSELLVVPVRIRASSGQSDSQRWEHAFPSLAQMQHSEALQRGAQQYLRRVLSRVLGEPPGSSKAAEALSRLRDLHLLLYLSLVQDEAVLAELCAHLLLSSPSVPLPPAVVLSLEQVLSSLPADP